MSTSTRSFATLRIFGDDLIPEDITARIGAAPTIGYRKGDIKHLNSGKELVRKTGTWQLESSDRAPEDLNAQAAEILARVTPDLSVWRALCGEYQIDLFCGWFMVKTNQGFGLSAATLLALGERGIEIEFDVYCPLKDEN